MSERLPERNPLHQPINPNVAVIGLMKDQLAADNQLENKNKYNPVVDYRDPYVLQEIDYLGPEIVHTPQAAEIGAVAARGAIEAPAKVSEEASGEEPKSPRDLYPEGIHKIPDFAVPGKEKDLVGVGAAAETPRAMPDKAFEGFNHPSIPSEDADKVDLFMLSKEFLFEDQEPDSLLQVTTLDGKSVSFYKNENGETELVTTKDNQEVRYPVHIVGSSPAGGAWAKTEHPSVVQDGYLHYKRIFTFKSGQEEGLPSFLKEWPDVDSLDDEKRANWLKTGALVETDEGLKWRLAPFEDPAIGPIANASILSEQGVKQAL